MFYGALSSGKKNIYFYISSLRGQTVHWIGAQSGVCMFLDARD